MKVFFLFDLSGKIDHDVLRKSENLPYKPINEGNIYDMSELKHPRNGNQYKVIIDHIKIHSIRNTFELLVKYIGSNIDILMVFETNIDDTFPETQFLIEGFRNLIDLIGYLRVGELCFT